MLDSLFSLESLSLLAISVLNITSTVLPPLLINLSTDGYFSANLVTTFKLELNITSNSLSKIAR